MFHSWTNLFTTPATFMQSMADEDGGTNISIPVGIIVGLLASFVQSLGLTIQRKSHVLNQSLPETERKVEHRRPLWLFGFGIFISSNLFGSIFQIASLPVVILAPLGAVSLLWNAFFARFILGDVFSPWMVIGTLLIAGGAVLIAVFGIVSEPTHSLEDLLLLFSRPAFIVYFSLLGVAIVVCLVITHLVEYSYSRRIRLLESTPPLSPLLAPTTAPTILTTTDSAVNPIFSERTHLLDRKPHSHSRSASLSSRSILSLSLSTSTSTPLFLAFSYASFSGILSGMCLLFAKSGVELLMLTIGGKNQFWRWQAWVLVLGLVVCALLQLWYMHKSLVLADPTLVCPLAFCMYNLSSIVNGLIYFDQFSLLSTTHLSLVLLGIVVLLAGVGVVSFPPNGGGGIDVDAWHEHDVHLSDDMQDARDDFEEDFEPYEDEPLPMHVHPRTAAPSDANDTLIDLSPVPTTREPLHVISSLPSSKSRPASPSDTRSRGGDNSPPISHHRNPTTPVSSSVQKRGRPSSISPRQSYPPYPHPLSPSGPPIGGFSIGLSPISPGFSLVPRERRRRSTAAAATAIGLESGLEASAAGINQDRFGVGEFRGDVMRRVVSDGAAGAQRLDPEHGDGLRRASQDDARRPKDRWRWLRSFVTHTDP